ncbi:hypothetical protein JOD29_002981 [Lysinibacillus composti]|uniref:Uncharacterized protein n=1 Tax=Lysinibacillus composti TaxID=720633 RepID=A0A3N9UB44_9BACI|nr:hypothetical protein [Lysinibacillus composti]MBM7609705.1 hypothetical protein [Lysinibacillus composti]RQW73627.1 hypothetical protein EBB45_15360 [Lysinibacillus composti]
MNRKQHLALIIGGLLMFIYLSFSSLIFNNEMLTMLSTELLFMILIVLYMGICLITFSYRKRYRNALESSFFITILILTGLPVGAITLLNILAYF